MAKPKEAPLFEEPEFDEKEFLLMEKERAKGIVLIILLGALIGLLAGYLQIQGYAYLSVLIVLAILVVLGKIITFFRIRISPRTSHKIINYGTYFLTAILFWIIMINPPLHVVSSPQTQSFQVQDQSGTWTNLTLTNGAYQGLVGTHEYSMHLTYRYNFTVTQLTYVKVGSPASNNANPTVSHGYVNFTIPSASSSEQLDFSLYWNSSARQNPGPLTFSMVFA